MRCAEHYVWCDKVGRPLNARSCVCICQVYEILQCDDAEKLIKKRKNPDESTLYYVSLKDTFEVIKRAHSYWPWWTWPYDEGTLAQISKHYRCTSVCARSVRRREKRDQWLRVWWCVLSWARSFHLGDKWIWLTCNPGRQLTTSGSWFIRIISRSSAYCEHSQPHVLLKLPSN